ncbi:hypothetical protein FOXYSP1_15883 [Fusarium oxysporum f. sp. phaseoli]
MLKLARKLCGLSIAQVLMGSKIIYSSSNALPTKVTSHCYSLHQAKHLVLSFLYRKHEHYSRFMISGLESTLVKA